MKPAIEIDSRIDSRIESRIESRKSLVAGRGTSGSLAALVPLVVVSLAILLAAGGIAAGALVRLDLDRLTLRSSRIVCGQVTAMKSSWAEIPKLGTVIVTDVTIRVTETWKGKPAREITVRVYGGKVGDEWHVCVESPRYTVGEKVLVFARERRGRLWTCGWLQGKFRLVDAGGVTRVAGRKDMPIDGLRSLSTIRSAVADLVRRHAATGASTPPSPPPPSGTPGPK